MRRFLIERWAPIGSTVALTGRGGRGKTTILQTVATCVQQGLPWCGRLVLQRPAVVIFGEESFDDILIRQFDINDHFGINFASQTSLHLISLKGQDCTWFHIANDKTGTVHTTPLFATVREIVLDTTAGLLGVDHWGLFVAGPEGDRHATATAINLLTGAVEAVDGVAIVLQHPPKSGAEYSGNTGFEGGVRALWYLDAGDKDDERVLRLSKANYEAREEIRLRYQRGLFVPTDPKAMSAVDMLAERERRAKARDAFLLALDRATAQRRNVSHAPQARGTYAPKFFIENGLVNGGFNVQEMETAMRELFNEGAIVADQPLWPRGNRHWVTGLGRKPAA